MDYQVKRQNSIRVAKDVPKLIISILARIDGHSISDEDYVGLINLLVTAYEKNKIPVINKTVMQMLPPEPDRDIEYGNLAVYNLDQSIAEFLNKINWTKAEKESPILFKRGPKAIKGFFSKGDIPMKKEPAE